MMVDDNEAAIAAMEGEKIWFLDVEDLEFDGVPLNTSASRYDFVTRFANAELVEVAESGDTNLPAVRDMMKKTVFVCGLSSDDFIRARKSRRDAIIMFDEWNDRKNLIPQNADKLAELMQIADNIWKGWAGGDEPDEDTEPTEDDPGKENGRL